jgi:ABC-type phosphate/phosphonate transport system permease subunit
MTIRNGILVHAVFSTPATRLTGMARFARASRSSVPSLILAIDLMVTLVDALSAFLRHRVV